MTPMALILSFTGPAISAVSAMATLCRGMVPTALRCAKTGYSGWMSNAMTATMRLTTDAVKPASSKDSTRAQESSATAPSLSTSPPN